MHYVVSDIHGCYYEYRAALERVNFSRRDTLYVLGDCIDRGYAPIRVLQDMRRRDNVIPIFGNHEYMALQVLNRLCVESTAENGEPQLDLPLMERYANWMANGGATTLRAFRALPAGEKHRILDYLGGFSLYETVSVRGLDYLLLHGGLEPFVAGLGVEDYSPEQILFSHADYSRAYFPNRYTISGHTPTITQPGNRGTVIRRNRHIAIDCGCVFGYNLALYCLETGRTIYIPYGGRRNR